MKSLSFITVLFFSIFTFNSAYAQLDLKSDTIKVWGNCGMCKTTIEKAAGKAGAATAEWNEDSKQLKVTYASNKTSSDKIQKEIAKSGYDTEGFKASDKAYDKLHGCCKYERKGEASSSSCCGTEGCTKEAADCKSTGCCKEKVCCKS